MTQIKISIDGQYCGDNCSYLNVCHNQVHASCGRYGTKLTYRLDDGVVRCPQCLAATVEEL